MSVAKEHVRAAEMHFPDQGVRCGDSRDDARLELRPRPTVRNSDHIRRHADQTPFQWLVLAKAGSARGSVRSFTDVVAVSKGCRMDANDLLTNGIPKPHILRRRDHRSNLP